MGDVNQRKKLILKNHIKFARGNKKELQIHLSRKALEEVESKKRALQNATKVFLYDKMLQSQDVGLK